MREPRVTERVFKPQLFWALREWINGIPYANEEFIQYLQNVLFFVPFGFLFPENKNLRIVVMSTLSTSVFIEFTQYVLNLGWCELDDVISNTIGAMLGVALWIAFEKIYRKNRSKNCVD